MSSDWADEAQRVVSQIRTRYTGTDLRLMEAALRAAEKRGELKGRIAGLREADDIIRKRWVRITAKMSLALKSVNLRADELEKQQP